VVNGINRGHAVLSDVCQHGEDGFALGMVAETRFLGGWGLASSGSIARTALKPVRARSATVSLLARESPYSVKLAGCSLAAHTGRTYGIGSAGKIALPARKPRQLAGVLDVSCRTSPTGLAGTFVRSGFVSSAAGSSVATQNPKARSRGSVLGNAQVMLLG